MQLHITVIENIWMRDLCILAPCKSGHYVRKTVLRWENIFFSAKPYTQKMRTEIVGKTDELLDELLWSTAEEKDGTNAVQTRGTLAHLMVSLQSVVQGPWFRYLQEHAWVKGMSRSSPLFCKCIRRTRPTMRGRLDIFCRNTMPHTGSGDQFAKSAVHQKLY